MQNDMLPSGSRQELSAFRRPGRLPRKVFWFFGLDLAKSFLLNRIDSAAQRVHNSDLRETSPQKVEIMEKQSKRWKFGVGIAIILAVALWEAFSGFQQSKTYYVTVSELVSGKTARQHVRVGGMVEEGSITRHGTELSFRLSQNAQSIPVVYVGAETLPDTFKDGAKAIVEGSYMSDGTFQAQQVQAKCASKYQALPPGPKAKNIANINDMGKALATVREGGASGLHGHHRGPAAGF